MSKEVPQGRGSGWQAWGPGLRERSDTLAGGGRAWARGCPEVSLARLAEVPAGSGLCGPSVLLGEFLAGISLPPAPWNGKISALGTGMAATSGRSGRLCFRVEAPENAQGGST